MAPRRRTTSPQKSRKKGKDTFQRGELKQIDKQMEQLQKAARSIKLEIAKKEEERVQQELAHLESKVDDIDSEDVDAIYNELMAPKTNLTDASLLTSDTTTDADALVLFSEPARGINVPTPILERIGDSVKYIHVKDNQNWNALISELSASGKDAFQGLETTDVCTFLTNIPTGAIDEHSLLQLNKMITDAQIPYNTMIYDFMMKHYAELNHPVIVQKLFDNAIASGIKPSKYYYGHLIKVYCKSQNIDRVNISLNKMFASGLEPSKKVYTNVLQMCVNLKDENEANEVFSMMKFRSLQSHPDVEAYNTMLQLCARTSNVHRALDLYQEMIDANITPTVFTFNTLAQVCSKDPKFLNRGWQFIHSIHTSNLEPNKATFQTMLRLAARDGDLELARALYIKLFELIPQTINSPRTPGPEALNYLLIAYRDFKPDHTPQIKFSKEGAIIRRNVLAMVDFMGLYQDIVDDLEITKKRERYPPMLPVKGIFMPQHIIAESNAVWAFNVANDLKSVGIDTLQVYLRIAVEVGDKEEFLRRWDKWTFANEEIGKNEIIIEEAEDESVQTEETNSAPPAIHGVEGLNFKVERESSLYVTLLSAGKRFGDEKMCQMAWIERGKYRKTSAYQSLDNRLKKKLDFQFSREMVLALTQLKLYTDAVGVVLASTQFPWSFYILKPLYVALEEIGDHKNAREISIVCSQNDKRRRR